MTVLLILLMACITFSVRYLFLIEKLPFELGERTRSFLSFTGPCVLSAMVAPILFTQTQGAFWSSPYLLAGIGTIIFSFMLRSTLLVVLLGMGLFFVLNHGLV